MLDINPQWLVHMATIAKAVEDEGWDGQKYADPIDLPKVRVDKGAVYSGSGNSRVKTANAVVYVYPEFCPSVPYLDDDWLNAQVVYDGKPHTLVNIVVNTAVDSEDVFSYELEVL